MEWILKEVSLERISVIPPSELNKPLTREELVLLEVFDEAGRLPYKVCLYPPDRLGRYRLVEGIDVIKIARMRQIAVINAYVGESFPANFLAGLPDSYGISEPESPMDEARRVAVSFARENLPIRDTNLGSRNYVYRCLRLTNNLDLRLQKMMSEGKDKDTLTVSYAQVLSYYEGDQFQFYLDNKHLKIRELEQMIFGEKKISRIPVVGLDLRHFEEAITLATGCVTHVKAQSDNRGKIVMHVHDMQILLRLHRVIAELDLPTKYAIKGERSSGGANLSVFTIYYDDANGSQHSSEIMKAFINKRAEIVYETCGAELETA